MKKITVLVALVSLLLTSCVVQENLTFNEDNSGSLVHKIDMSKVMELAGDKIGDGSKKKRNKKKERASKDVDSTFTFKEIYAEKKDSIAKLPLAEQERLKKMERYSGRIIINEAQKKMNFHFFTDFKNPTELQELVSPVNAVSSMNPSGTQISDETPKNEGETTYKFDGKKFTKIVKVNIADEIKKELDTVMNQEDDESDEQNVNELSKEIGETFKKIYENSLYEITVNFPKKIAKVSIENAQISEDGKSVTISFPMENYMESKNMDFEVELE